MENARLGLRRVARRRPNSGLSRSKELRSPGCRIRGQIRQNLIVVKGLKCVLALSALLVTATVGQTAYTPVARRFFYEHDTHFSLTYVLMRLACFSHKDALIIASADQNVDDCGNTDPSFNSSHNPKWHALDDSKDAVLKRKEQLWNRAMASKDLVQLGQYFHYQEDSWGHRQGHGIGENWEPYGPTFGHAKDLAQPDRVPYDKERAREMAKEKLAQAQEFNRSIGHQTMDVPADVPGFLIDAMCLPYTHDAFGLWNQVDPDKVADDLNNLCQKWYAEGKIGKEIKCPKVDERLRYEFDEDGKVTNGDDVQKKLDKIEDYNFPVRPVAPAQPDPPKGIIPSPSEPVVPVPTSEPVKPVQPLATIGPSQPTKPIAAPQPQVPAPPSGGIGFTPPVALPGAQTTVRTISGSGPNGNYTIESKVTSSVELVDTGVTNGGIIQWCYSDCLGRKHSDHASCDFSCDKPCDILHGMDFLHAYYKINWPVFDQIGTDIEKLWPGSGVWAPSQAAVAGNLREFLASFAQTYSRIPSDHFSKPCGAAYRRFGYHQYKLVMHLRIESSTRTDGKPPTGEARESTVEVATLFQPDVSKPWQQGSFTDCYCVFDEKLRSIFNPKKTPTEAVPDSGIRYLVSGISPFTPLKGTLTGVDLNTMDYEEVDDGVVIYFPGGETFIPDDPSYQEMVTVYGTVLDLGGRLLEGPSAGSAHVGQLPVACLEIDKKQPNHSVKYHAAPNRDPVLRRLALTAEWENVHGPWDQARLWIYENHSTLEQINNRLIPGVPPGMYVKCLYEVAHEGFVDLTVAPFRTLLEPRFVFDAFGSRDATIWFIQTLADISPEALATFVTQGAAAWGATLKDNDRDYPHAADIIDGLSQTLSPALHDVIPTIIAALPDAARARILNKTILGKERAKLLAR